MREITLTAVPAPFSDPRCPQSFQGLTPLRQIGQHVAGLSVDSSGVFLILLFLRLLLFYWEFLLDYVSNKCPTWSQFVFT
jgi:hypothetical protein